MLSPHIIYGALRVRLLVLYGGKVGLYLGLACTERAFPLTLLSIFLTYSNDLLKI